MADSNKTPAPSPCCILPHRTLQGQKEDFAQVFDILCSFLVENYSLFLCHLNYLWASPKLCSAVGTDL